MLDSFGSNDLGIVRGDSWKWTGLRSQIGFEYLDHSNVRTKCCHKVQVGVRRGLCENFCLRLKGVNVNEMLTI